MSQRWTIACLAAGLTVMFVAGCDRRPQPPPPQVAVPPAPPPVIRPTTQELMQGTWQRLSLLTIPYSVEAPPGWKVKPGADGATMSLSGQSARFDYDVHITQRPAVKEIELPLMLRAATRESAERNNPHYFSKVSKLGDITVLERMVADATNNLPGMDVMGQPLNGLTTPIHWRIDLYTARDKEFVVHEVAFFDMTAEQYDVDHELLRRIVDSIQPDVTAR